jgi:TolA-binding protein
MKALFIVLVAAAVMVGGCSRPSPEESFAKAEAAHRLARKTADSLAGKVDPKTLFAPVVKELSDLISEHPTSPLAERALFLRAAIRTNDTKEHELAVSDYRLYAERYPEGEKTPLALFLVGYIYNNELHNLDSAAAAYRLFLQKYPTNEMAMSAQFELNTLGKTPEELVAREQPDVPAGTARVATKK